MWATWLLRSGAYQQFDLIFSDVDHSIVDYCYWCFCAAWSHFRFSIISFCFHFFFFSTPLVLGWWWLRRSKVEKIRFVSGRARQLKHLKCCATHGTTLGHSLFGISVCSIVLPSLIHVNVLRMCIFNHTQTCRSHAYRCRSRIHSVLAGQLRVVCSVPPNA